MPRPFRPDSALACAASLLLCACASTYQVKVDALTAPRPVSAVSYKIVNQDPTVETDSLRYKEVANAVRTALSAKGMYEAPEDAKPDVIIALDYGIKPPRITEELRSEPIYATSPGRYTRQVVQTGTDRSGNPIMSVIGEDVPSESEYVGDKESMVPVVTYQKYLRLSARENKPAGEGRLPQEVWTVEVTSDGPDGNLRQSVPVMAAAAIGYIGRQTSGQEVVEVKDGTNSDLSFVKKGI